MRSGRISSCCRTAVLEAAAGAGHLQVLGDMGRGKTSTLLGLAQLFRGQGRSAAYEYLTLDQDTFATALAGSMFYCWMKLSACGRTNAAGCWPPLPTGLRLVLGSHEDLAPLFSSTGLRLSSVRLDNSSPARLAAILNRRLAAAALPDSPQRVTFDPTALAYLDAAFGSNLRAMERLLYEVFQRLEAPEVLTAERLQTLAASL